MKKTIDEKIHLLQKEYIQSRKKCEALAKEITRLSALRQEKAAKTVLAAIEKSGLSFEKALDLIRNGSSTED